MRPVGGVKGNENKTHIKITMKELKLSPGKEIHTKKQEKQEYKIIGSTRIIPGLKLYEFDYNLMQVKRAYIKKSTTFNLGTQKPSEKNSVFHNKNAYYYQCVNLKNALKKANKIIKSVSGVENYFKLVKGVILRRGDL